MATQGALLFLGHARPSHPRALCSFLCLRCSCPMLGPPPLPPPPPVFAQIASCHLGPLRPPYWHLTLSPSSWDLFNLSHFPPFLPPSLSSHSCSLSVWSVAPATMSAELGSLSLLLPDTSQHPAEPGTQQPLQESLVCECT